MEGKSGMVSIILFVIIGLLSVTLAAVVIGFFVLGGNSGGTPQSTVIVVKEGDQKPAMEDLTEFFPFGAGESKGEAKAYNLKPSADGTPHVLLVMVEMQYFKTGKVDGLKDDTAKLMEFNKGHIQSIISNYMSELTLEEALDQVSSKKRASETLVEEINKEINPTNTDKKIVYSLIFTQWFAQ